MDKQITFRFAQGTAAGALRGLATSGSTRSTAPASPPAGCGRRAAAASFTNQTCPFTGAVTGSHRIYLVFSQATGGPASGFGC
jgi:hypothetical protein